MLPARISSQYAPKTRLVRLSVATIRVSQVIKVPVGPASRRNSIPTLIQPGRDHVRSSNGSSLGGVDVSTSCQARLSPAESTDVGGLEKSTGIGVSSRKVCGPRGLVR